MTRNRICSAPRVLENAMDREDLMKADLFSEIVLLGSCLVLVLTVILIVAAVMTRSPAT
jgi:hypothetical protein